MSDKNNYELMGPIEGNGLLEFLPHRDPFVMVSRIDEIHVDVSDPDQPLGMIIRGKKKVLASEPHFKGHFPDQPIMPGVLVVEAMAQVAAFSFYPLIALRRSKGIPTTVETLLLGVDGARFRKPVVPGDELHIEALLNTRKRQFVTFSCKATISGKVVAEADLLTGINWEEKS